MYPVILLWCWVHPKHRVMLMPWPVAVSTALSSLWNKLNQKAKWDQSLTDTAINNHRICWVDCSQFGVNGFFVIMLWYLAVIQTLNKCHLAGKIPGACFFMGEILEGHASHCSRSQSCMVGSRQPGRRLQCLLPFLSKYSVTRTDMGNVLPLHTMHFNKK